ncbi:MAG: hypothetical protein HONBIEJF_00927 [Fimbriimonadaceae bacterium]|nr:hypothetical protein [Fimbriimonadaceae bacterium]
MGVSMHVRFGFFSLLLAAVSGSQAQEALFLTPDTFVTASRESRLLLSETKSTGPAIKDWTRFPARWVFIRTGLVQENRDAFDEWLQQDGSVRFAIPGPGPVVVGVDFAPQLQTVDSTTVSRIARQPSLPRRETKIRHFRSALTVFQTDWPGEQSPDSGVATAKTSLASSIHPLMDPTKFRMGSDMALELVVRGQEVEEAEVFVVNLTSGKTWVLKAQGGLCKFTPDAPGTYEFKFQYVLPVPDDPEADFDFFSTTLTFSIPAQKEAIR